MSSLAPGFALTILIQSARHCLRYCHITSWYPAARGYFCRPADLFSIARRQRAALRPAAAGSPRNGACAQYGVIFYVFILIGKSTMASIYK